MLGRIKWGNGRRITLEQECLCGLPVLVLTLPRRAGERTLRRGARLLSRHAVKRVLVPAEFDGWPVLYRFGLRAVDTGALRCALAPDWVRCVLKLKGVDPERAVLRLTGERVSPEMESTARILCGLVRDLMVDVPGGAGLAAALRRDYGLPVLPAGGVKTDLTLAFAGAPVLRGASFRPAAGIELPPEVETLPVLSVLWENHRIKAQDIAVKVDFS